MQEKIKRQGTRAGPATVNDEVAHGAEMAGLWVWRGYVRREDEKWGPLS